MSYNLNIYHPFKNMNVFNNKKHEIDLLRSTYFMFTFYLGVSGMIFYRVYRLPLKKYTRKYNTYFVIISLNQGVSSIIFNDLLLNVILHNNNVKLHAVHISLNNFAICGSEKYPLK